MKRSLLISVIVSTGAQADDQATRPETEKPMTDQTNRPRHALAPLLLTLALATVPGTLLAGAAVAEMLPAEAVAESTLVEMGSKGARNATVRTEGRVVFRNGAVAAARIVFARKDATAFDCVADGDAVVRSRASQYMLRGGAELSCVVRPGRYRYTTLTQSGGGVHQAKSILSVRN